MGLHGLSSGIEELGEIFAGRDRAADDAEVIGLAAEDLNRVAIFVEPIGVEVLAHQRFGLLELGIEPRADIRELALRCGELVVAADKGVGQVARDPFVPLPDLAAQDDQVLRRKAAGPAEVVALDRPDVGKRRMIGPSIGL